jgi:hypothetical protein
VILQRKVYKTMQASYPLLSYTHHVLKSTRHKIYHTSHITKKGMTRKPKNAVQESHIPIFTNTHIKHNQISSSRAREKTLKTIENAQKDNLHTSPSSCLLKALENNIRSLLSNHVRRHGGESAGNPRENTSIDDTEASNTTDVKFGVKHSHLVVVGANGAGGRSMVTPRGILCILRNLLGGVDISTRQDLVDLDELALESVAGEVDGFGEGSQILLVVADASVEVVVGDFGHVEGVGRAQGNSSGVVTRVRLEDRPGEPVVLRGGVVGIAREVAAEVDGSAKGKDVVVVVLGYARLVEHGSAQAGRCVKTAVACAGILPALHAFVGVVAFESAAIKGGEVGFGFALHVDLVVVLEVGSYTGAVGDDGNVKLLELFGGSDTTELQELRRVVGSAGEDDFARCLGGSGDSLCARGLGAGLVEELTIEELNTSSAGRGDFLVEKDLGDMAVHPNVERVHLGTVFGLCVANGQDELAGSSALAISGGNGDLVETGASIALLGVGVGITSNQSGQVDDSVGSIAKGKGSTANNAEKLGVVGDNVDGCVVGAEPTVVTMGSRAGNEVLVLLQLLKVLAHVGRGPRVISSDLLDVLEIRLMGVDSDESVVSCAASESTSTRV